MKKKIMIIFIALLLIFSIYLIFLNLNKITKIISTKDINLENETSPLVLTATQSTINNQIDLSWSIDNTTNYLFRCFQSINNSPYQSISSTDFSDGSFIRVLNIYPNTGNNLKTWMETNGYGRGIMRITDVNITNFNSNPNTYLKDVNGNWAYDVIVFGFYDSNNGYDLSSAAYTSVDAFIKTGRGAIFGHDTLYSAHPYFASLSHYVNITNTSSYSYSLTNTITLSRKGVFTTYPWNIGNVGTVLTIPTTHNLDQIASGDIWITLNNGISDPRYSFYLTTYNSCAMIQTGHSNGAATPDEQKVLANLIFYTKQLTNKTVLKDYSALDYVAPNPVNELSINYLNNQKAEATFGESADNGSDYSYYVQAISQVDGSSINSNTVTQNSTSGLARLFLYS